MSPTTSQEWKPSPRPRTASARDTDPEPEASAPASAPEKPKPLRTLVAKLRPRPGHVPPALIVSTVAWSVTAFLTVWAGFDALGADPSRRNAQDVRDQLGNGTVSASTQIAPQDVLALVVGGCLFAVLMCALAKQRWARPALSVSAVAAVVVLALGGHWEAAIVFFAFIVGAVTLLAESVQRYLE